MKKESKYHFRRYRLSQNHPFLVAIVFEDKIKGKKYISGFNMTHSLKYVESRKISLYEYRIRIHSMISIVMYLLILLKTNLKNTLASQ